MAIEKTAKSDSGDTYRPRERSRSPYRRSPDRSRRRSYSPRRSHNNNNNNHRNDYRRSPNRARSPYLGNYPVMTANAQHQGPGSGAPRDNSKQERRVYVGNLAYDVRWYHLKDFMAKAGEVLFADILLLPNGMSKGCAVVEYSTREQAQNAIQTLSNQDLMGRLVYVREMYVANNQDREAEPRPSQAGGRPGPPPGAGGSAGASVAGRQLYVGNLSYNVGWQDLKDLFRPYARNGGVSRADVQLNADGRSKGSGIVLMENADDARSAIQNLNNYEWKGRRIEVREDRFAGSSGGPPPPPPDRGGFSSRGGFADGPPRGGPPGRGGHHDRGNYAPAAPANPFTDNATAGTERSSTIYVRNLPWSTSNEDLVELFITIGNVEQAEIQLEPSGRSKGAGVVRFDNAETAEVAISKFQSYQYGGRPLGLSFVRYMTNDHDRR